MSCAGRGVSAVICDRLAHLSVYSCTLDPAGQRVSRLVTCSSSSLHPAPVQGRSFSITQGRSRASTANGDLTDATLCAWLRNQSPLTGQHVSLSCTHTCTGQLGLHFVVILCFSCIRIANAPCTHFERIFKRTPFVLTCPSIAFGYIAPSYITGDYAFAHSDYCGPGRC